MLALCRSHRRVWGAGTAAAFAAGKSLNVRFDAQSFPQESKAQSGNIRAELNVWEQVPTVAPISSASYPTIVL